MLKRVTSFVTKCSGVLLISTSFVKGNAMMTRSRIHIVLILSAAAMTFGAPSASAVLVNIDDFYTITAANTISSETTGTTAAVTFTSPDTGVQEGVVSAIDEVTLDDTGDFIEMTFTATVGSGNNQNDRVRLGLFNDNGNTVTANNETAKTDAWDGYFMSAALRSGNGANGGLNEQSATAASILGIGSNSNPSAESGISELLNVGSSGLGLSTSHNFTFRIERTATGLTITGDPFTSHSSPTDASVNVLDANVETYTFNAIALSERRDLVITNLEIDTTPPPVPEPSAAVLALLGLLGLCKRRRNQRS